MNIFAEESMSVFGSEIQALLYLAGFWDSQNLRMEGCVS